MNFGISVEVDSNADSKSGAVQELSNFLHDSLKQDYGSDVQHLTIGLICVRSVPGYEAWYKPRKPRFQRRQLVKMLDGSSKELVNAFSYDIRLTDDEYELFISASTVDAVSLI